MDKLASIGRALHHNKASWFGSFIELITYCLMAQGDNRTVNRHNAEELFRRCPQGLMRRDNRAHGACVQVRKRPFRRWVQKNANYLTSPRDMETQAQKAKRLQRIRAAEETLRLAEIRRQGEERQRQEAYAISLCEIIGPLGAKQVAALANCATLGDIAERTNGFREMRIPGVGPKRTEQLLEYAAALDLVA